MPRGQPRWEKRLRGILACAVDRRRSSTTRRLVLSLPASLKEVLTHEDDAAVINAVRASRDVRLMLIGFVSAMSTSVKRRDAYFPGHADVEIASLLHNEACASFDADQSASMRAASSAAAAGRRTKTREAMESSVPPPPPPLGCSSAAKAAVPAVLRSPADVLEAVRVTASGSTPGPGVAVVPDVSAANNTARFGSQSLVRNALRIQCTPEEKTRFELLASTGRKLWDPPVRASQESRPRSPLPERLDLRDDDEEGESHTEERDRKRARLEFGEEDDPDLEDLKSPALAAPRIPMPRPSQTPMFNDNAACSQATPSAAVPATVVVPPLPGTSPSPSDPLADARRIEQNTRSETLQRRPIDAQGSLPGARRLRLTVVS